MYKNGTKCAKKDGYFFCRVAADLPSPPIWNPGYAPDGGPDGTLATGPMKALGGPDHSMIWYANSVIRKCINLTIKKARKVSGMIIRNINYKDKDIMVPIYKALIRPILEYGNVVWCPHLLKDIKAIEKVQQHFTKTIKGYYNMSYPDRLKK